jgi:hypothetical protein
MNWTVDQILALAPDPQSAKTGSGLATLRKWDRLGRNSQAVWGECQGSGQKPYQTTIDLNEPAFKCSCPSRKFPCKHALGLFLLSIQAPDSFGAEEPPAWVQGWLEGRVQRQQKVAQSQAMDRVADPAAQARRAAKRQKKVDIGLAELERWLFDLVREGLASVQGKPRSFWETPAARLVDAQAGGAARRLRRLATLAYTGEGWQERLVEQLGLLYLLVAGYRRLESLPEPVQADLRTLMGWSLNQESLLAEAGVTDRWSVVGQQLEQEQRLLVQRTWLWSQTTNRGALLLQFAAANQPLDRTLVPGTSFEAELVFYPTNYPLRALLKERRTPAGDLAALGGYLTLAEALTAYGAALACCPWLEEFPLALQKVRPFRRDERWFLADEAGQTLPLSPHFKASWTLLALSGGQPLFLFGVWDGSHLLPLSTLAEGRFIALETGEIQAL